MARAFRSLRWVARAAGGFRHQSRIFESVSQEIVSMCLASLRAASTVVGRQAVRALRARSHSAGDAHPVPAPELRRVRVRVSATGPTLGWGGSYTARHRWRARCGWQVVPRTPPLAAARSAGHVRCTVCAKRACGRPGPLARYGQTDTHTHTCRHVREVRVSHVARGSCDLCPLRGLGRIATLDRGRSRCGSAHQKQSPTLDHEQRQCALPFPAGGPTSFDRRLATRLAQGWPPARPRPGPACDAVNPDDHRRGARVVPFRAGTPSSRCCPPQDLDLELKRVCEQFIAETAGHITQPASAVLARVWLGKRGIAVRRRRRCVLMAAGKPAWPICLRGWTLARSTGAGFPSPDPRCRRTPQGPALCDRRYMNACVRGLALLPG